MTKVAPLTTPIWCPGCGDFGVLASLKKALSDLGIKSKDTVLVGGIGCSGSIHNNLECYGVHSLHGRLLPTAIGVKLANPNLTVIAAGGDGDGYAIGAGHFIHTLKKNPSIVYIVMQNGTYGLTKGQPSPTAVPGYEGNVEPPFDAIATALSIESTSFIARGFSGNQPQLTELMKKAITHANEWKGFAFLEVLSPCVTYNDTVQGVAGKSLQSRHRQGLRPKQQVTCFHESPATETSGKNSNGTSLPGGQQLARN